MRTRALVSRGRTYGFKGRATGLELIQVAETRIGARAIQRGSSEAFLASSPDALSHSGNLYKTQKR